MKIKLKGHELRTSKHLQLFRKRNSNYDLYSYFKIEFKDKLVNEEKYNLQHLNWIYFIPPALYSLLHKL